MIQLSARLMHETGDRFLQEWQALLEEALQGERFEKPALCLVKAD